MRQPIEPMRTISWIYTERKTLVLTYTKSADPEITTDCGGEESVSIHCGDCSTLELTAPDAKNIKPKNILIRDSVWRGLWTPPTSVRCSQSRTACIFSSSTNLHRSTHLRWESSPSRVRWTHQTWNTQRGEYIQGWTWNILINLPISWRHHDTYQVITNIEAASPKLSTIYQYKKCVHIACWVVSRILDERKILSGYITW